MFMDSQRKASAPTAYRQQQQQLELTQNFGANQTQQSNKEIMTITIEIGNGKQAHILIRENDDPMELAQ